MRKYRDKQGFLLPNKVPNEMLPRLRGLLQLTQCHELIAQNDILDIIVDTGCTNSATPFKSDFVKNSMFKLAHPIAIEGVGGDIVVEYAGILKWEFITSKGDIAKLYHMGHYAPALDTTRLLSPQSYFKEKDKSGKFVMQYDKCQIELGNGSILPLGMHPETFLPVIHGFNDAMTTAKSLAYTGSILDPKNLNLTVLQKELLRFHDKLGHLGMQATQWLGRQGVFGKNGHKWGSTNVKAPHCEACSLGKQHRIPKAGSTIKPDRDKEGILKQDKLKPGDLVFTDQYVSSLPGQYFNTRSQSSSQHEYRGGTLFADAASGYIYIVNQVGFTADETIAAKLRFEREAQSIGVQVKQYSSDNGVYISSAFGNNLRENNQTIRHSGVGGHHHNGAAENGIKNVVMKARTMMFNSALRWPESIDLSLWPLALQHAAHLYNEIPKPSSGIAPVEIWTTSKSSYSAFKHAHPWGCPAMVLHPKLQDGHKIPKWEARARKGQYVGASALHASSVGMIRNLKTGNISPQFHVVYDDCYETVVSDHTAEPEKWENIIILGGTHKADYDDTTDIYGNPV